MKKEENKDLATVIWNEIKDKKIDVFALPNQSVEKYCTPVTIEPSKLYLTVKASAVLPALESALGPTYHIEQASKYFIISKV